MIRIERLKINDENLNCPTFYCDICDKRIDNINGALLTWDPDPMPGNELAQAYIVHKGLDCDGPPNDRSWPYSDELRNAATHLRNNSDPNIGKDEPSGKFEPE